jgi:hypothetical protein
MFIIMEMTDFWAVSICISLIAQFLYDLNPCPSLNLREQGSFPDIPHDISVSKENSNFYKK